jgi:hypothetical protein
MFGHPQPFSSCTCGRRQVAHIRTMTLSRIEGNGTASWLAGTKCCHIVSGGNPSSSGGCSQEKIASRHDWHSAYRDYTE